MRAEYKWMLAGIVAFALGIACAEPYARLAAPYYGVIDRLIARGHPWEVLSVGVGPGKSNLTAQLELWAYVRRHPEDLSPAAKVQGRVQVGEAIETPIVFWTLLLVWPARTITQRLGRLVAGVPIFLLLEAMTTATQLVLPMAQASAILAGGNDAVTGWEYWSRFLEAGGQFVLICGGAIVAVSVARWPGAACD